MEINNMTFIEKALKILNVLAKPHKKKFFYKSKTQESYRLEILVDDCLSTHDNDKLTRMIFLAHDYCCRLSIQPCNMQYFKMVITPRDEKANDNCLTHNTIEKALKQYRVNNPARSEPNKYPICDLPFEGRCKLLNSIWDCGYHSFCCFHRVSSKGRIPDFDSGHAGSNPATLTKRNVNSNKKTRKKIIERICNDD